MKLIRSKKAIAAACTIFGLGTALASVPAGATDTSHTVETWLTPSSPAIANCLPQAKARVRVKLATAEKGKDAFDIAVAGLPANTEFTVFLLETPGAPFGASEYIGDFATNEDGKGRNHFELIVEEAFASTIVNGQRVRADMNHIGFWFADPADDDACVPGGGPVTPFDGDNEAGVQAMNSASSLPGAPLP